MASRQATPSRRNNKRELTRPSDRDAACAPAAVPTMATGKIV